MGNVAATEAADAEFEEGEKGIVIGVRHDENSNPSSPSSLQGPPNFSRRGDSIADVDAADLEFTEVPTPPDGGYGWVVVVASFLINMIVDGVAYSFGVFMPAFVEHFDAPVGKVAWVSSLLNGVYLSAGPIVSGLTNVYGCRPVTIAGATLAGVAFLLSTTVPSVSWLMIVYGVVGGLGFGLMYLPAIVAVNYYFESKRALATGIAVCGSGVGTFVFAPLASYMLQEYNWEGSHIILAGIIFNGVVCGALMRPLVYKKPKASQKPLLQAMAEDKQRQMKRNSSASDTFFFVKLPDGTLEKRTKWKANGDPGVHSSLALNEFGRSPSGLLPPIAEAARTNGTEPHGGEKPKADTVDTVDDQQGKPSAEDAVKGENKSETVTAVDGTAPKKPENAEEGEGGTNRAGSEKADSEKGSDEEKNDVVPELPSEELGELGRKPSGKRVVAKRRSSVPKEPPPANGAALPKNVSTPLLEAQRRGSGATRPLHQSASGNSLNPDLRRLSFQNRRPGGGGPTSQEELWLCSNTSVSGVGSRQSLPRPGEMLRPLSRRDVFYSGSVLQLAQYQSQRSLASYRASVLSLPRADADERDPNSWACVLPAGCGVLSEMVDMSLLRSPLFLVICLSNVLGMLGFYVPFVYIVDAAVKKGVAEERAAFLLSVIGITNTVGRVLSGYVTDLPRVDALLVNNVCLAISGVCLFLVPACTSYASFVAVCVAFGLFIASFISLTCVILVDLMGLERLVNAFGLVCICRGLAAIVGAPVAAPYVSLSCAILVELLGIDKLSNAFGLLILSRGAASFLSAPMAGALFDYTGDYDVSFYAAGGLLLASSFVSCMVPPLRWYLNRRSAAAAAGLRSPPPEVIVSGDDDGSPVQAV